MTQHPNDSQTQEPARVARKLYTLAEQADARYSATIAARCPGKTRWTLTPTEARIPEIRDAYRDKINVDEAWLTFLRTNR